MTRADSRFYLPSQVSMPLRFLPYITRNNDYICPPHIVVGLLEERGGVLICAPEAAIVLLQGLGRGDCGVPLFLLLGGDPPSSHRGCTCLGRKLDCVVRVIHIVIVICFSKHGLSQVWLWKMF
jgi:hypothetical protein